MELIDLTELQNVLQDFAKDIRENYQEHLEHSGRYTTERSLIDSVKTQVVVGDNAFEVTMTLKDYWKYVEDDTRPHFPPPSAIMRWVEIKPIIPRPFDNGRIPTQKQLAYLIGRKIADVGTKGSHDLAVTKENVLNWYRDKIAEALGRDAEKYLRSVITNG